MGAQMQYGFQRLVLLNSAGYSRAELPLDGAVSLVAPNNTGKTSLINALQYLLIIDRRRMDFGAHDIDKTRRFYFPHNSAYVLLEVFLPESGSVVLGCVGKGVSYDYEYFSYAGSLNVEEFALTDGSQTGQLVAQPQLASHLATHGRRVFAYSSQEFADMLYAGRQRRSTNLNDFSVFRLENASDAAIFQRVLTRTLRLDKLRSAEVKDYLLQIFRNDLPDASIDFKAEWDKAFAELNLEREQYLAALKLQTPLEELAKRQEARLILRGKILAWRPLIDQALHAWHAHYQQQQLHLQTALTQGEQQRQALREQDLQTAREQSQIEHALRQVQQENARLHSLQQRFALLDDVALLHAQRDALTQQRDALIVRLGQAQSRAPQAIRREQQRIEQELQQLSRELHSLGNNLYQHLAKQMNAEHLALLNQALSKPLLTLGAQHFRLNASLLKHSLDAVIAQDSPQIRLPGLELHIGHLPAQYQQRSAAELAEQEQELKQQLAQLQQQLDTAQALESVQAERRRLDADLEALDHELRDYHAMQDLQHSAVERQNRLHELQQRQSELEHLLASSQQRSQDLEQARQAQQQALNSLHSQQRSIEQMRKQRQDHEGSFSYLAEMPHQVWRGQGEFAPQELAERLQTYLNDCRQLVEGDSKISQLLHLIHGTGLSKYQYLGADEEEIQRLIAFAQHLPQEAEALEKKARSAVVNIAASLRELRGGLHAIKRRMREFNRKISGRKLSDLAVFAIEAEEAQALVEAIDLLISTSETVDHGASFNLFNQQSLLDDEALNRAKSLLIAEGQARHGLRVADLFHLRFWVGKSEQTAEGFDDLDSAASNGTVLMAKLVTGLAMLHLMQDPRFPMQGICYLDEALALDARNQRSLIDTAAEFGFNLIFASPAPLTTARYCVPIQQHQGRNHISRLSWQIIEPLD